VMVEYVLSECVFVWLKAEQKYWGFMGVVDHMYILPSIGLWYHGKLARAEKRDFTRFGNYCQDSGRIIFDRHERVH